MAELRCKTCGGPLVERESKENKKFLACPKSYKGNNHGTYSEGEYFYVEDRAEEGEGKYYWLPPSPTPTRTYRSSGSTTWPSPLSKQGRIYQGWVDACNQYREDLGHDVMVTGTEYDLGMTYWEGHY